MHNIYFIQPNYVASPGAAIDEYYLPYSVGVLWAAAQQSPIVREHYNIADIVFRRELVDHVVDRMQDPFICVFSCYIWNWEYNKKLAQAVKQQWPDCKIIFGGPQVTDRPFEKLFFSNHRYVDCVINGEGEVILQEIMEQLHLGKKIKRVYQQPRIADLTHLPSPYLTGVFDKIIKDHPQIHWHAVLETNRGCPYACTYCDWGSATYSKIKKFNIERVLKEIEWFGQQQIEYLFIADANFGIFPERDQEIAQKLADVKNQYNGYPRSINANWQKNSNIASVDISKILGSRGFTVSAQSMDLDVLKAVRRDNMKVNNLKELFDYCHEQNIPTYTDMILGMPNETLVSWKTGLLNLLDYGQHDMIIVYFTQLLENAEMMQQLDEYKIEFVKTDNWEAYYGVDSTYTQDPVREWKLIVNQTNTMSRDDMVRSYMFSWLISIFHGMGYTQSISKYLHKTEIMSYREFYDKLELYIAKSSGILNSEYTRIKKSVTDFFTTGHYDYDYKVMRYVPADTLLWSSLFYFPKDLSQVKLELQQFFDHAVRVKFFTDLELYKQLTDFQNVNVVDYFKTYPEQITVSDQIFNTINDQPVDNVMLSITVDMHPALKNLNIQEFCSTLFVQKRNSLHKLQISTISNITTI